MTGTSRSRPALRRKSSTCGITCSKSKRGSVRSATLAAPRWPPAQPGCSMTMASGARCLRSHFFTTSATPRASDRIGISATRGCSRARSGRSSGNPAPTTTASMPASSAHFTEGAYSSTARITLTASNPPPLAITRAAWISRASASRLAALIACLPAAPRRWPVRAIRSGWCCRRSTDEIVPTAPSAATLPANRCAEMPTPMPPCTIGSNSRPARRSGRNAVRASCARKASMAEWLSLAVSLIVMGRVARSRSRDASGRPGSPRTGRCRRARHWTPG